jgi:ATP-dependent RNA helicase DeaD
MLFENLPPLLAEALSTRGYSEPTPVQAAVLETEAEGRDLIVSAQTGSGKTVAFGLAMAPQLLEPNGSVAFIREPMALVIAPTRELALQVSRELIWLYGKAGARIATCVGGMDASKERRTLAQGAHVVVGTPGRLRDHLERGALDLTRLRVAVLDEADEMLDMGFREDLEEILDATPQDRRTLLFSGHDAEADRRARQALPEGCAAHLDRRRGSRPRRHQLPGGDRRARRHRECVVNLLRLHEAESALLFCATRDNVRRLHSSLTERGFSAVALSGEHSQNERNQALQALRDGRSRVLVATDVAARGIDLPNLSLVIHVELPRDAETLQHRSGRTGRAGKKGTAILIVPYPRRKRVESVLRGARIEAQWVKPPTPEDIRKSDHERLLAALLEPVEHDEEDRALAERLLEQKSPQEIAAALVRVHRARMPAPEEMVDGGAVQGAPRPEGPRAGFEDTIWFRMDIGRRHNADPRWLLPLLCRRGHITKNEIGAIRIAANETMFEIPRAAAARFAAALKRTQGGDPEGEGGVRIEPVQGTPRDAAKQNRRQGPPQAARHQAKPYRAKPARQR